jgi:hypothetical protein
MSETAGGRCCVFQPFDKGPHDKRYDETVAPAIVAAGLEPYRVDRDDGAVIPIDTLHDEIRSAAICFADISTRNPNVMYELGYAIASNKEVVIICAAHQAERFPFDIQHRGIITYTLESASDFEQLKTAVTNKIKALLKRRAITQQIAEVSPVKSTHGLQPNEITALALIMANVDSSTLTGCMIRMPTGSAMPSPGRAGIRRLGFSRSVSPRRQRSLHCSDMQRPGARETV